MIIQVKLIFYVLLVFCSWPLVAAPAQQTHYFASWREASAFGEAQKKSGKKVSYQRLRRRTFWALEANKKIIRRYSKQTTAQRALESFTQRFPNQSARIRKLRGRPSKSFVVITQPHWWNRFGIEGLYQPELAYLPTGSDPHFQQARQQFRLKAESQWGDSSWKLSTRFYYDPVFDFETYYDQRALVSNDRQSFWILDESFIDFSILGWEVRAGRQHLIWGELIGAFVADSISRRDLRDFILMDFRDLRLPQWAVLAEKFTDQSTWQLFLLPYSEVDLLAQPGDDYSFFSTEQNEVSPLVQPDLPYVPGGGLRYSTIIGRADTALFAQSLLDREAEFAIVTRGLQTFIETRHQRIHQLGLTESIDLDWTVFKLESVASFQKLVAVDLDTTNHGIAEGYVQSTAIGFDFSWPQPGITQLQWFDNQILAYQSQQGLREPQAERRISALVRYDANQDLTFEASWIYSLLDWDALWRGQILWKAGAATEVIFGYDEFTGNSQGVLGRFREQDRGHIKFRRYF